MSADGECPESTPNVELCNLMVRLKLENPELGRKGMLTAVQAEGRGFKEVKYEQVKRTWKKMMKRTSKEYEETTTSDKYNSREKHKVKVVNEGQATVMNQNCKDEEEEIGASNTLSSKEKHEAEKHEAECEEQLEVPLVAKRSRALEKQLKMRDSKGVTYVVFTAANEPADMAIQLVNTMGVIFFNLMWNRVVEAPYGSPKIKNEMWIIFQQLESSLNMKYKKVLRKQLQAEFGVDPFEGKSNIGFKSM